MNVVIGSKRKIEILTLIFNNICRLSNDINLNFTNDRLYIQGMDASHVCVYELYIKTLWFESFNVDEAITISIKSSMMCLILGLRQEQQKICLEFLKGNNKLNIKFINEPNLSSETSREFNIPTMNINQELIDIPNSKYDASFLIKSNIFTDIICFLSDDNDDYINLKISRKVITIETSDGKATSTLLDIDNKITRIKNYKYECDSDSFSMVLSIKYIVMFCSFYKVEKYVKLNITKNKDIPFYMEYTLEDDVTQYLRFYLVPKIDKND